MKAGLRAERPHCTCVEVRNFSYAEAAEKLSCKRRFLEDRIRGLPHQKLGESVAFCDCELRLIQRLFTIIPDEVWERLLNQQPDETTQAPAPLSLRTIKPAGAYRPRATAVQ